MIDFSAFQYRGYTVTQLDEMIDFYKRQMIAPPEGSMKAELSKRGWEQLLQYSKVLPPQSITVEVTHDGYTYRGTAQLVSEDTKE